jgi:hypothetical protein
MMHGAFLISISYSGCPAIDSLDHQERRAQVQVFEQAWVLSGK